MKARPIVFSGPMVRALLAGAKTQTRRVIKPQPDKPLKLANCLFKNGQPYWVPEGSGRGFLCPYGAAINGHCLNEPGDLLWVRETWMDLDGTGIEHYGKDQKRQRYAYGAESPPGSASDEARKDFGLKWRPSIHMPRAASRLTLRVTDVRVQRLQEISEADAQAEGVDSDNADGIFYYVPGIEPHSITAVEAGVISRPRARCFGKLWEHINGPGSWEANPWVWAISFEVIKANVDQVLAQRTDA